MMLANRLSRRLVALTTICASLSLATAATVAAYPITPEGEPLHLDAGATPSLAPDPVLKAVDSGGATSRSGNGGNVLPLEEISSSGTDWIETGLAAIASLAVLALAAAAFTVTGRRRESARIH